MNKRKTDLVMWAAVVAALAVVFCLMYLHETMAAMIPADPAANQGQVLSREEERQLLAETMADELKQARVTTTDRGILREVYSEGYNTGYRHGIETVGRALDLLCPLGR